MKRINNPCYDCEDRKIVDGYTCHTECQKYKHYKELLDERRKTHQKLKSAQCDYRSYRQEKEKRLVR